MTLSVRESRVRIIVAGGMVALAVVCLGLRLLHPFAFVSADAPAWFLHGVLPHLRKLTSDWSLASMAIFPLALLAILLLERRFPAVPDQKTLSTGLVHDVLWVLIQAAVLLVIARWYGGVLYRIYTRHLSFLTLPVAASLPVVARLAIGALAMDFGRWCDHWLLHHVSWLWPFHAVHHAQRELNLFSDYRTHIVELIVRYTALMLPMLMLKLEAPAVTWWLLLLSWHARLYHANIRSDFGALRYLLVTPQSHRVHHSRHPEHFDRNYGAMLSVWDHLFGTQYRHYDIYPETGVEDETFPVETARSVAGVFATTMRQLLYPFHQLWMNPRRDVVPGPVIERQPARDARHWAVGRPG